MVGAANSRHLSPAEREKLGTIAYERLKVAVWVYDFDLCAVVWANRAALALWKADSVEALAARDLGAEMSDGVASRLNQYREDFATDDSAHFTETWTLYPGDEPRLFECSFIDACLDPDRAATLIYATPVEDARHEPATLRALDSLLHSQVMIGLFTIDGRHLFTNRAVRERRGPGAVSFGGNFVNPDEATPFLEAARLGKTFRATVEVKFTDGPRWVDIHAAPCRDAATGKEAFQVSSIDVTETRRSQEALKAALSKAEAADRAKSEFVASMSHEMRTPLNGVLGMLEILGHTALDAEQTRMVEVARDSGMALLALVEDVLDLSSIELGAVTMENAVFDLVAVAEKVVEGLSAPAAEKGLSLTLDASALAGSGVSGDPRRVAQLMRNLIGNAIKFTGTGAILLRLARGDDAGTLLVEVCDTGPGVPEDKKAAIFQRFHREGPQSRSRGDGLGLGLAICRDIVTLWRGEIGVRDAPRGGACFWFTVPGALSGESAVVENAQPASAMR